MSDELQTMGIRLAFRKEGAFVNCYVAKEETMADATLIGSMRRTCLDHSPDVWEDWKALMKRVLEFHIKTSLNLTPEWGGEHKAPEHERSGEA